MSGVQGRTVVVTGANGALGQEVVRRLVAEGATVAAIVRGEVAAEIAELPGVSGYRADLSDHAATADAGRAILAEHGGVDGLLHLVGGWRGGTPIDEADPADWDFLEQGLIRSLQNTTQALYPALAASSDARVAIISSVSVAKPTASNAAYASAKAAAEAWTLALADAFSGGSAAAVILRVMALLTPQMRADQPERKFPRYTPIGDVAERLVGLWDVPVGEVNGTVVTLVPEPGAGA
ncbi:SDR family NAD(P)-dependent oxidoreductase [Tsukamurella sp. PLM1]|uniref:SDR family NAD(P)-dependent oxidoreductase n=1 Tax=Tsukamurella sp. PLM1 TaxID=2929795 RepID=UPI00205AE00B|nr:SDR family NAD(P)-dependent oxidoreductase [Tsukamurella sp. PLM1]BDH58873.1 oxidoreductase [Tsukamurella sp. PLM1]